MAKAFARLPNWRPRLGAYLAEVGQRPFAYGSHDCALFVAGAVQAMTGRDLAAGYRGRYTSFKGGLKALHKRGQANHLTLLRATLTEVPSAFAQVGDVAVIETPGEAPSLGIFEGQHIAVLRETGLGFVPRAAATLAFRVP